MSKALVRLAVGPNQPVWSYSIHFLLSLTHKYTHFSQHRRKKAGCASSSKWIWHCLFSGERNQLKAKHSRANSEQLCYFFAQIVSTNCVQHRLCGCVCMLHDLLIPLVNRTLKRVQINYAISGRNSFLLNFPFFLFSINKEKSKFPVVVVEITKAQVLIKQSQKMITVLHIDAEMWLIVLKC